MRRLTKRAREQKSESKTGRQVQQSSNLQHGVEGHHRRLGQDRTGQDRTGQDRTGQDRTGQDRTGQDRTGQDRTGQDRTGQVGEHHRKN